MPPSLLTSPPRLPLLLCPALPCRAATFGYWTEAKAEGVMEGFKKLVPKKCKVLRDGSVLILDAVELVPGGCWAQDAGCWPAGES